MIFSKTRVGMKKESNLSETAVPTLNPRWRIRPHKILSIEKKTNSIQDKMFHMIFKIKKMKKFLMKSPQKI